MAAHTAKPGQSPPKPKPFPWEKLAVALLGILTALGGWTLKTVVETNAQIAAMQERLKGVEKQTGDIQLELGKDVIKVDDIKSSLDQLKGKLDK